MVKDNMTSSSFIPDVSSTRLSEPSFKSKVKDARGPDSFMQTLDSAVRKEKSPPDAPVTNTVGVRRTSPRPLPLDENQKPVSGGVEEKDLDDTKGMMNQSYEQTAVSYPVKRIAREAVDDETKETLEDQNLWNLPTVVAAQPNAQMMVMAKKVEDGNQMAQVPVARPVAQFMASMENELGVTPDRLVQAIRNLPPGALQESPEKTMPQVIANLGLQAEDEIKAMQLYSQMLRQMEKLESKDKVPLLPPVIAGGAMALAADGQKPAVVSADPQSSMGQAPQKLDQKLRQTLGQTPGQMQPLVPVEAQKASSRATAVVGSQMEQKVSSVPLKNVEAGGGAAKQVNADAPAVSSASESKVLPEAGDGQRSGAFGQSLAQQSDHQLDQQANQQSSQQANQQMYAYSKPEVSKSVEPTHLKMEMKGKTPAKIETASPNMAPTTSVSVVDTTAADTKQLSVAGAVEGANGMEAKPRHESKHEAVQSIIQNAQMLAQKGGGEMRLSLKPEHLGEIHLHVALEGERVNVQMMTQTSEAKKLIEQSVSDLKHGLASHNLSMDKLNVTVNDKNTGGFQQSRPDFGTAREFAQQFHQQNQARREMADLEFPGAKGTSIARTLSSWGNGPGQNLRPSQGAGRLDVVA